MRSWIAFWGIVVKDMRAYYLKPPNVSWGLLFPLVWTGMYFIRSGLGLESVTALVPGVAAISVLFGTTSMLAVTVTFEKRNRSFDRLLLAPIPLETLMLAKTGGAICFGVVNAFVPVAMAAFLADLSGMAWGTFFVTVCLVSVSSAFLGLFIAVAVSEVFEAQTFSNFFRFPMLFLCGLFFPVAKLPALVRPLSYALPLTYGVDALRGAMTGVSGVAATMPMALDLSLLGMFCVVFFTASLWNVRRKWIA
ncbi:ABC transporter permease [Desulfolutivibrio sulfoxidireducens]|uniref:ABC transporter permease n=1 Tax=Desulfolutivibrio sulfoxidireducens TaxID=2773299 RepID=UPI00159CF730|nr:ABC transporter permease [Desulfolutivibrio sulfoxidireducens]QLA15024.1 ABC transporter permease [Desulfolutivibrio sulfoxidireducens]QLA18593.1 ABC transporter permease [Desulfolutivibrio sulfoxidireducens]